MKKYIIMLFILLGMSSLCCAKDCGGEVFTVSSEAEVLVQPDAAKLTFGISIRTKTLEEGKDKMKSALDKAFSFCAQHDIARKYIQLNNINISPFYYSREVCNKGNKCHEEESLRYNFNQSFAVTLKDLSSYEEVLYGLLGLGINQVEDINFYSDNMRKYRDEARLLAVKNAKEKAELFSEAAGIKLGRIINVRENTPGQDCFRPANTVSNISQNSYSAALGGASDITGSGLIKVKSSVTLTYKI